LYGFGKVDAAAAVRASVAKVDANPMGSLRDWIALYRPASAATGAPQDGATAAPAPPAPARIRDGAIGVAQVQTIGAPVLVVAGLMAIWLTLAVAGVRAVRRVRQTR
jgi:membrane-anchored mycosin MYCP